MVKKAETEQKLQLWLHPLLVIVVASWDNVRAIRQYATSADFDFFQQLNSMDRIVSISDREKELHRVAQTIYEAWIFIFSPPLMRLTAISVVFLSLGTFVYLCAGGAMFRLLIHILR